MKRSPLSPYSNTTLVFSLPTNIPDGADAYGNSRYKENDFVIQAYLKPSVASESTNRGGVAEYSVTLKGYITAPLHIPSNLLYNGAIANALMELETGVIRKGLFRVSQSYKTPVLVRHKAGLILQPLRGLFTHK